MVLIALGSNIPGGRGAPRAVLEAALAALESPGVRVLGRSGWWRTPAFPPGSGPDFVNAAARLEAPLAPEAMLHLLHAVETELGRERPYRWAPRVCDLDLLACGDAVLPDPATVAAWMALAPADQGARTPDRLLLPHPRLHERGFVLAPLAEVAPDWVHPLLGRSVGEMLDRLPPDALAGVRRL